MLAESWLAACIRRRLNGAAGCMPARNPEQAAQSADGSRRPVPTPPWLLVACSERDDLTKPTEVQGVARTASKFPRACFCYTVSVDYLTKPIEVFKEMHRCLKPGGLAVMSFSNRCFPTKGGWAGRAGFGDGPAHRCSCGVGHRRALSHAGY